MKNKFSIAMSLAMIVTMLVTSLALAAELVTAEVTGTGNDVTVTQGTSVTSTINLSATGTIACAITSGSPSIATVDTSYSLNSSGVLTTSSPSSGFSFYSDGVPSGGPNCGVTWSGASTPYSVTATFSAAATTPIGNYTVTLQDSSAGTTDTADVTNPSVTGGKLGDVTPTTITVHVVAPVVTDSTPPVITKTVTGTLGNNSWYTSNVLVDWTVSDPESSFTTVGCVDTTISSDTSGTTLSCSATSAGGTSSDSVAIKRDATAPTGVSGAPNRPADNGTWYNQAVDVVFSGTDATSGIASCTSTNYSGPDGSGVTVNGSCTDNAGNTSAAVASSAFNYDGSAPTALLSVTAGTAGANGWYTSDVTISTTGSDAVSGVTCTLDQSQTSETAGTVFNGSCTNGAGLTTNAAPLTVKLDKTGPSAALAVTAGTLGNNGWYTSDVTVSTSGSDSISGPASCTVDQFQNTETAGTEFNGSCTNDAGLSTDAAPLTVKLDKTAPSASASAAPAANGNGWNNTDVTVSFTGTDALSGIDSCDAAVVLSSEGAGQSASGDCTDKAGNVSASATASGINIDKTAPTASASASPAANVNGWNNSNVTVSFTGSDSLSGLDSCDADVVLSGEGAGQSASGTCTDLAGNVSTSATASGINIDKTAPIVSLVGGPANGASYYFGSVPAAPTCSASDALSGLDGGCSVSGYSNAIGGHTVTANATDKAGNSASASATYTVLAWTINGFYQPVDMGKLNISKNGSTVPLKFEVFAGPTELTNTSIVSTFVQKLTCGTGVAIDDIESYATGGTSLRYDTTGGQFIFNWQTPKIAGNCYRVTLTTSDGTSIFADFKLK